MDSELSYEQYYEIAYTRHRIMNPLPEQAITMFADLAGLGTDSRILDIGSGKGYTSLAITSHCGAHCTQVDKSEKWVDHARELFENEGLVSRTDILLQDAKEYAIAPGSFDLIICLGNTPIYGGFAEALAAFLPGLKPGGFMLIGEATVREDMPKEYTSYLEEMEWMLPTEEEIVLAIEEHEIDMHYARRSTHEEWDMYMGLQWTEVQKHIASLDDDPLADNFLEWLLDEQESYLRFQRHFVDWTVFLLAKPLTPLTSRL